MAEPYIGQIAIFGFNFAPLNWVFCNGALLSIAQNQAFFAIIGTYYGGDGRTTFAVPNIGNSGVVNQGQGPGLSSYVIGETAGITDVTLTSQQMPTHTHVGTVLKGAPTGLQWRMGHGWASPRPAMPICLHLLQEGRELCASYYFHRRRFTAAYKRTALSRHELLHRDNGGFLVAQLMCSKTRCSHTRGLSFRSPGDDDRPFLRELFETALPDARILAAWPMRRAVPFSISNSTFRRCITRAPTPRQTAGLCLLRADRSAG